MSLKVDLDQRFADWLRKSPDVEALLKDAAELALARRIFEAGFASLRGDLTPDAAMLPVTGSDRDIYEVANQLGGYVGPDTDERLAQFLIRESDEAALLANELVRLRVLLENVGVNI